MACFPSSLGNTSLTAPWISIEDSVLRLAYLVSLPASLASLSNMPFIRLFKIVIALDDIPIPGCTCFNTLYTYLLYPSPPPSLLFLFLFFSFPSSLVLFAFPFSSTGTWTDWFSCSDLCSTGTVLEGPWAFSLSSSPRVVFWTLWITATCTVSFTTFLEVFTIVPINLVERFGAILSYNYPSTFCNVLFVFPLKTTIWKRESGGDGGYCYAQIVTVFEGYKLTEKGHVEDRCRSPFELQGYVG